MCPPREKVKTKGSQTRKEKMHERSTKRNPSYFEHVDKIHSIDDSCSSQKGWRGKSQLALSQKVVPMLDQFHPICHQFIEEVVDVKADGNCGYRSIAAFWVWVKNRGHWFVWICSKNFVLGMMNMLPF